MTLPNCQTMVFQEGTAELLVSLKSGGQVFSRRNGSPAWKWPRPPGNVTLTKLVSRLKKRVALDHLKPNLRCRCDVDWEAETEVLFRGWKIWYDFMDCTSR